MLFAVRHGLEIDYVEAASFEEALRVWRNWHREPDPQDDPMPDQIDRVSYGDVLRANGLAS